MKKAQSAVEYIIYTVLAVLLCAALLMLWNRDIIIQSVSGGIIDQNNVLHIPAIEGDD